MHNFYNKLCATSNSAFIDSIKSKLYVFRRVYLFPMMFATFFPQFCNDFLDRFCKIVVIHFTIYMAHRESQQMAYANFFKLLANHLAQFLRQNNAKFDYIFEIIWQNAFKNVQHVLLQKYLKLVQKYCKMKIAKKLQLFLLYSICRKMSENCRAANDDQICNFSNRFTMVFTI